MSSGTPNMTVVRLATAAGAFVVVVVILLVILAAILHGSSLDTPQVVSLITSVGVLVTLAAGLAGTFAAAQGVSQNTQVLGTLQTTVDQVHDQVNGHLEAHAALTAENIQALIDKAVEQALAAQKAPEERSA